MAKIISSNNQPIVDQNHQLAQEQQHDQQQQSSKVLQSTRSQNKINNANEKDTNNKISEQGEDIENCNINDSEGSDKNKSSSSSSSNSSDNENNVNSEKNPDATNSTTTTTAGGGNKKLCVVIPPNNKTLLTPTIVTNEPCATPSHLLTSLIQLNGQDVGLFTGLPSCTPTSADSLSTSNLGGINPFFWGVSSFNQDANNNNGTNETTLNNDFNQRVNKQTTIDSTEMKVVDENVSKQTLQRNHQTPGKLSLDQIQAANAILSPLSLFLSPEGLRFVDANQHPLAGLSGINHELSGHNLSAVQNDLNLSNNYHNQTTAAAAAAAAAATCVAAQDLTSNSATENPQQTVNCPISSSASSILQARPTITTVQQYNSQQQQQQAVNQISQSIYSQNQHQLDQTAAIVAPSNTHQLSPRALSQHNQLIYHQQHSIGTTNEEVSVENHLHHIVQQQQQQQQQQHHVVYAQTQPILSLQCKTLERQPPAFGPPAAHHHHQVQNIHHPQQQPQQHQQAQLNSQQLFAVSEQQAVQRQIEYQHQHQSHQHHHHQQQQQQHIDRARQSSSFPCEQTSQTTIGLYDPQFRNIYLAQQQQQQHNFTGQQGYQSQTISCIQQDHNFGSTATPASQKQPDPPSVDTVRVLGRAKDDLAVAAAPKRTPPLNGKHKQDKVVVSQTVTKTSEAPKITNKPPKNESQSKVKRPNKTKVTTTTIEVAPVAAPTTVTPNGVIDNNGEVLVKKKSKGGRKKKIVTHDELIARKNRSKERNRVAAKRCRLKRKQFLDELCGRIDNLNDLNKKLQKENSLLKGELDILKQHHKTCKV